MQAATNKNRIFLFRAGINIFSPILILTSIFAR